MDAYKKIKTAKKLTPELLRHFVAVVGGLENSLPVDMVEMSASKRVLARGDEGEFKPLPESSNQRGGKGGYNKRPQGQYRDDQGGFGRGQRGDHRGGRDRDRGGYNKNPRYTQ